MAAQSRTAAGRGKGVEDANQSRSQGRDPGGRRLPRRARDLAAVVTPGGCRLPRHARLAALRRCRRGRRPLHRLGSSTHPARPGSIDRPAQHPAPAEPPRHERRARREPRARAAARPGVPGHPHAARRVQRPGPAEHGHGRVALRPQRPARCDPPRAGRPPDGAQPAHRQPRAAHAHHVPAGRDAEPVRRIVDPVHDQGLVQPWTRRPRPHLRTPAPARRPVAGAAADGPEDDPGCDPAARRDVPADVPEHQHALVGRLAAVRHRPGGRAHGALGNGGQAQRRRRRDPHGSQARPPPGCRAGGWGCRCW